MNYFDDLQCFQVRHVKSGKNGTLYKNTQYWGIGLMQGEGFVRQVSDQTETLRAMPFLYLIRPAAADSSGSCWQAVNGSERENSWFIIQGTRAKRLIYSLESYCRKNSSIILLPHYKTLDAILKKMLHLYTNGLPSHSYRLSLCVEEFVSAIYDALSEAEEKDSPIRHLVKQTARQIILEPGKDYDFAAIAESHQISHDHFRRIFRQYSGQSLHEFLLEKRLFLGRELLQRSTLSIKEISERCGFPRQAEFARFIKQRTGSSPSELRKLPEIDLA